MFGKYKGAPILENYALISNTLKARSPETPKARSRPIA